MATTGNILTDILIIWVPLAIMLLMGIVGLLRGAQREAVVSIALVLAALIVSIWTGSWSSDLHDSFSSLGQQDTMTWLGVVVLVLITLVVGYGLGSALVPRGPISGISRLGGFVVGFANGAALSGWLLRNFYNALLLDLGGSNGTVFNTLQDNPITYWLIIWAGWFPLVVALVAAIVALTGPFRRAQTAVATPSTQSNWTPSTAPAVAAGAATAASSMQDSYNQPYSQPYSQPPYPQQPYPQQPYAQQPYAQQQPYPQFGTQPQPQAQAQAQAAPQAQPAPAAAAYSPTGYGAPPATDTQAARVADAPPTMPMSTGDATSASASAPAGVSPAPAAKSAPSTGPLGDLPGNVQSQSGQSPPVQNKATDSSWLATPKSGGASSSSLDNSAVARSEAPTMAYQVTSSGASPSSVPGALTNCARCGATVPADATFCTECGNRLKG
jgi:uncharacterized membrane protein required for colicin V production